MSLRTNVFDKVRGLAAPAAIALGTAATSLTFSANQAIAEKVRQNAITEEINFATNQEIGEITADAATHGYNGESVAILILLGEQLRSTGKDAEYFKQGFINMFAEHGVEAKVFFKDVTNQNSMFEFYTQTEEFAQMNLAEAIDAVPLAADNYKRNSTQLDQKELASLSLETN